MFPHRPQGGGNVPRLTENLQNNPKTNILTNRLSQTAIIISLLKNLFLWPSCNNNDITFICLSKVPVCSSGLFHSTRLLLNLLTCWKGHSKLWFVALLRFNRHSNATPEFGHDSLASSNGENHHGNHRLSIFFFLCPYMSFLSVF